MHDIPVKSEMSILGLGLKSMVVMSQFMAQIWLEATTLRSTEAQFYPRAPLLPYTMIQPA
jgi:hypothetical protein